MSPRVLAVLAVGACAQGAAAPDAQPIDAIAIDARAIDAPGGDGGATLDTCAGALDLTAMAAGVDGATVTGSTTGLGNDIQPPMGCTGFVNDGPDAIYQVTIGAGQRVTATLTPQGWDGALTLIQPCTFTPVCLAGSDNGTPEVAVFTATAATAIYVVVDSYGPEAAGAYTLNVRIQ